jgi:hypothetical protein
MRGFIALLVDIPSIVELRSLVADSSSGSRRQGMNNIAAARILQLKVFSGAVQNCTDAAEGHVLLPGRSLGGRRGTGELP